MECVPEELIEPRAELHVLKIIIKIDMATWA
jgi:hypothetical protein